MFFGNARRTVSLPIDLKLSRVFTLRLFLEEHTSIGTVQVCGNRIARSSIRRRNPILHTYSEMQRSFGLADLSLLTPLDQTATGGVMPVGEHCIDSRSGFSCHDRGSTNATATVLRRGATADERSDIHPETRAAQFSLPSVFHFYAYYYFVLD